jgi:hypothetical protein
MSLLSHTMFILLHCKTFPLWRILIFWYITPCSPLKINQRSRGTCCLHLQGRSIIQAINQYEGWSKKSGFLHGLFFEPEDGCDMFLQRTTWRYIPEDRNRITTAVRTSNPMFPLCFLRHFACGMEENYVSNNTGTMRWSLTRKAVLSCKQVFLG